MDHLIDDSDRLKPCPFCGGEATFDHDDNGWNWIECTRCGASTNARVSAMDDCKPLLLEQWNKRVPPTPQQVSDYLAMVERINADVSSND